MKLRHKDGNGRLYSICALLYLNSTMAGLDASLIGNLNTIPAFQDFFGTSTSHTNTGVIFASMQVGGILGAFTLRFADTKGRLFCIRAGSLGVIVGALIQGLTSSTLGFIIGRLTLGLFSTLACRSSSIYLIEIAPPERRGTIAGLYNTLFFLGSILATASVLFCHSYSGNSVWRFPVLSQCIFPSIVACGVGYLPESPRWLMAHSRPTEARDIMVSLHGGGVLTIKISEEIAQMEAEVRSRSAVDDQGWSSLYSSQARRRRVFILLCMSFFGQFSGNNVITYYLPALLSKVGISNVDTKLYLNALYALAGWLAAASGAKLHDVYGRRILLYTCTTSLALCMGILAISLTQYEKTLDETYSSISLLAIYSFGIIFAAGYTSMQPVYPAEVMTNDMRARGMALATICGGTGGCLNTLFAPVAMAKFGSAFFFFFCAWDLIEAAVIHRFFVETKGRTLEELEYVFQSHDPVAASLDSLFKQRMV